MNTTASISLRSSRGVTFGRAQNIELTRLAVETPATLELGTELEFQLELPGLHETVYGSAIVRKIEQRDEELDLFHLAIQHLRAGDEILLREWVEDMAHGGTSAHPHRHVHDTHTSAPPPSVPTRPHRGLAPGAISTWDLHRTAAAMPPERGRGSVRAALRQRLRAGAPPSEPADPEVSLVLDEGLACLELRFGSERAWRKAWSSGLKDGGMLIPLPGPHPALGSNLELVVRLLDGTQVCTVAKVEALLLEAIGIAVVGDPASLFSSAVGEEEEEIEVVLSEP